MTSRTNLKSASSARSLSNKSRINTAASRSNLKIDDPLASSLSLKSVGEHGKSQVSIRPDSQMHSRVCLNEDVAAQKAKKKPLIFRILQGILNLL